jgi:hypothetical protein
MFRTVWMALGKYMHSQLNKSKLIDFPLVGKFYKRLNDTHYIFFPHLDFIESGHFTFKENDYNHSPFSKLLEVSQ